MASPLTPAPVVAGTIGGDEGRPLRRDAEANRQRILAAASGLMAEEGLAVPLEDIARAAGVGIGTLYRRFPTRDDLIKALFEDRLAGVFHDLEASFEIEDGWEALVWFLRQLISVRIADRAFSEVLERDTAVHDLHDLGETLMPLAQRVIDRAHASGRLRPDFEVTDLAVIERMVVSVGTPIAPGLWERYLAFLLDAMAANKPLPGLARPPAPTQDLLEDLFRRGWTGGSRWPSTS